MENKFETEVLTRLTKIETKLDDYKKLQQDATEALNLSKSNKEDIIEMKDNSKWLWRTVAGSIMLWILQIFYSFIGK